MHVSSGDMAPPEPNPQVVQDELRRTRSALTDARREAAEARAEVERVRTAGGVLSDFATNIPGALWVADAATGRGVYVSPGISSLLGVPPNAVLQEAGRWLALVHPDDRPAVASRFEALRRGEAAEVAYRVLPPDGAMRATGRSAARWVGDWGFPIVDESGDVRRVAGFAHLSQGCTGDEGLRRLLLAELNHRVRNALAAVQSVAAQTARATPDPRSFWEAFAGRLRAMARAHDMLAGHGWPEGADVRTLVEAELAPYLHTAGPVGPQAEIDGPLVRLRPAAALALALALHELATNAAKHGALSLPSGRIRVCWAGVDQGMSSELTPSKPLLRLEWIETGGPELAGPPARQGFGARLLTSALPAQLGGRITLKFAPAGLHAVLEAALSLPGTSLYTPQADPTRRH